MRMSSVPLVRPRSGAEIEDVARSIIQRFQPNVLESVGCFDVEAFFEFDLHDETDVEPVTKDLPSGLDGFTDSNQGKCFISNSLMDYRDRIVIERRLRSTLAHEIGHCCLHVADARKNQTYQQIFRHDKDYSIEMYDPDEHKVYEHPEWQAWRFAGALLMPEITFRRVAERNWTKRQMQNAFGVNLSFLEKRLRELKISKLLRRG